MNIIKTLSQIVFSALSPASVQTPAAGQAAIGISDTTKRLFSIDENGIVTTYGATGEYNDFVNGRIRTYWQDFLSTAVAPPFSIFPFNAGSIAQLDATPDRLGIWQVNKSTTASGGARAITGTNSVIINGEQYFEAWVSQNYQTSVTARIGFFNSDTTATPTNAAYFEIANGIAVGKCIKSSSQSSTGTLALTDGIWYKFKISVNATATSVSFEIRNESEAVLLSQSITTNIPVNAPVGFGFIVWETSTTARTGIFLIDTIRADL